MIEVAIMVEGQNGLTWHRWQRIAAVVEACGYNGLYRSDHYTNANPPDLDSLECWTSLTWLASHTRHIEFGPLVSPVSFRHPTHTARMAAAIDDLSGGRLTLGIGAGWQEREHAKYGWELLSLDDRFTRLEEGLEVISKMLKSDQPVDYSGKFFRVKEAILLPRPQRHGGPPILVGGNGKHKTLPLVARFAQEWNMLFLPPGEITTLNSRLDKLLLAQGRQPHDVRRSLMTGCVFGKDDDEVARKVDARTRGQRTPEDMRQRGLVVGTGDEIVGQCQQIARAGIQRVMLQWLDLDDTAGIEAMADGILDRLSAS
jgi:F420-dependent oxidoreductase-like protein